MRPGAHSSGVEAPEGRTIYVSGHVSMDDEGNLVEVSALIDPRLLIEIEAVAVIE
jgi:hypothetical protein